MREAVEFPDPVLARLMPAISSDRHWAVGMVLFGQELAVAEDLRGLGNRVWMPVSVRWRRERIGWRRQRQEYAVIGGYLFIDVRTIGNVDDTRQAPGFVGFVQFGDRWGLVADSTLDDLKRLEVDETRGPRRRPVAGLKVGDMAMVRRDVSFSLGGLQGEVREVDGNRVVIDGGDFTWPVSISAEKLEVV